MKQKLMPLPSTSHTSHLYEDLCYIHGALSPMHARHEALIFKNSKHPQTQAILHDTHVLVQEART